MKKTLVFLIVVLTVLLILSGCNKAGDSVYKEISPKAAKEMLEENSDVILIDVRTQAEYDEAHIPGSILIPYDEMGIIAPSKLKNKNDTIIVYCRTGRRSEIAANTLLELGYTDVYDLGGIADWPYEVE